MYEHLERFDGVSGHDGNPISESLCIFAEPPACIGTLLSAGSNLVRGDSSVRQKGQYLSAALWYIGAFASTAIGVRVLNPPSPFNILLCVGLPICIVLLSVRLGRVTPIVTFLGESGFAIGRTRGGVTEFETLAFAEAHEFFVRETIFDVERGYGGSVFWSCWKDQSDRTLIIVNGAHYEGRSTTSGQEDLYSFFVAARNAWNKIDLGRKQKEFETEGRLVFLVEKFGHVAVEDQLLEVNRLGKIDRISREEIGKFELADGVFFVERQDASSVTSRGHYSFGCQYVANMNSFVHFIQAVVGASVT